LKNANDKGETMNLDEMRNGIEGVVSLEAVLKRARNVLTGEVMSVPPVSADGEHFKRGEDQGDEADYITLSVDNVWGGQTTSRWGVGHISSYERIGYHSGSAHFMAGVLRSGCPTFVYHADGGVIRLYRLQRTLRRDQVEGF
jgi:hypothetical protein